MKRIFAKIIIAIAAGILLGDLVGTNVNINEINSKLRYKPYGVKVEKQFHRGTALLTGTITAVILSIILLAPEFKKRRARKKSIHS